MCRWLLLLAVCCTALACSQSSSSPPVAIGSAQAAFIAALGQPNNHSDTRDGVLHFSRCSGSNLDRYTVTFLHDHAVVINRQSCDGAMSSGSALSEAKRFLPPDSEDYGALTIESGEKAHRYFSPSLGGTVAPLNTCGQLTPPAGTTTLVFAPKGWDLVVGDGC